MVDKLLKFGLSSEPFNWRDIRITVPSQTMTPRSTSNEQSDNDSSTLSWCIYKTLQSDATVSWISDTLRDYSGLGEISKFSL